MENDELPTSRRPRARDLARAPADPSAEHAAVGGGAQRHDGYLAGPGTLGDPIVERPGDATAHRGHRGPLVPPGRLAPVPKNKLAMFGLGAGDRPDRSSPSSARSSCRTRCTRSAPIFRTAPDDQHWFGTDQVGRDVLARVVYGIRLSLFIGFVVTMLETIIGVSLGALAGLAGPAHRHVHHAHRRHHARHPLPGAGLRLHRGASAGASAP